MDVVFITESQYQKLTNAPEDSKYRAVFAWMTMICFWSTLFIRFLFIEVTYTDENLLRFREVPPDDLEALLCLMLYILGFLTFSLFVIFGFTERFYLERRMIHRLRWVDLAIFCSWIYVPWLIENIYNTRMILFFTSCVIVGLCLNRKRFRLIGFHAPIKKTLLFFAIIFAFGLIQVVQSVGIYINSYLGIDQYSDRENSIKNSYQMNTDATMNAFSSVSSSSASSNAALTFLAVCLLAPIAEEILFRGYLQTLFTHYVGRIFSVILTALLFSLYHVDVASFFPLFFTGIIFGIFREVFKSVWAASALHMFMNMLFSLFF
ncbi:CAAX prenyl protease-like protein [Baia soyae]|uniref:CAAX prenyl protease-like protein n=1 Tax=Baia soyae TaxID=1544746 RepID=A0A4R2S1F3_9BACL|nr:CAAX prenyl protease-like protein [Baia soyae]